jgi:hypothetical protein
MEAVGFGPRGNEPCGRRRSGVRYAQRGQSYSSRAILAAFCSCPSVRFGIGKRLASSNVRLAGNPEVIRPKASPARDTYEMGCRVFQFLEPPGEKTAV